MLGFPHFHTSCPYHKRWVSERWSTAICQENLGWIIQSMWYAFHHFNPILSTKLFYAVIPFLPDWLAVLRITYNTKAVSLHMYANLLVNQFEFHHSHPPTTNISPLPEKGDIKRNLNALYSQKKSGSHYIVLLSLELVEPNKYLLYNYEGNNLFLFATVLHHMKRIYVIIM